MGRAAACIAFLGLCACLLGPAAGQNAYVDHANRFGFTPPVGWQRQDSATAAAIFVAPLKAVARPKRPREYESTEALLARLRKQRDLRSEPEFRSTLAVHARPFKGTLAEWAKRSRQNAAKSKHYHILAEKQTRLAGVESVERIARLDQPGEPSTFQREVTCLREGRLYTVVIASAAQTRERDSRFFDRVLLSFTWRG